MSTTPRDTFLGRLEIIEVYEYYDRPVLFTAKNGAHFHYLVMMLDETSSSTSWLYVAVSQERWHAIRMGQVSLRAAYQQAEDAIVYEVTIFDAGHPTQIRILPSNTLTDEQLPAVGEVLHQEDRANPLSRMSY